MFSSDFHFLCCMNEQIKTIISSKNVWVSTIFHGRIFRKKGWQLHNYFVNSIQEKIKINFNINHCPFGLTNSESVLWSNKRIKNEPLNVKVVADFQGVLKTIDLRNKLPVLGLCGSYFYGKTFRKAAAYEGNIVRQCWVTRPSYYKAPRKT